MRDVEKKLQLSLHWNDVKKPKAPLSEPRNQDLDEDLPLIYDLITLAFQTDSTRIATLEIGASFKASNLNIKTGYHALSHHGHRQEAIDQLVAIERYQIEQLNYFLGKLKSVEVAGQNLLDRTMVLNGSGMGNANAHTNKNLPIILAGGGFKHGEHKAYPQKGRKVPLCNLYLSMLHRFGVEVDSFQLSTGTLNGLEVI